MGSPGLDGQDHVRVGKMNMVDLAGSERQSKTGATGDTLKARPAARLAALPMIHQRSMVDSGWYNGC